MSDEAQSSSKARLHEFFTPITPISPKRASRDFFNDHSEDSAHSSRGLETDHEKHSSKKFSHFFSPLKRAVSWAYFGDHKKSENRKQKRKNAAARMSTPPILKFNPKLQRHVHSHSGDNTAAFMDAYNRTKELEEKMKNDAPTDEVLPSRPTRLRINNLSASDIAPPLPEVETDSSIPLEEEDVVLAESPVECEPPDISEETLSAIQTPLPVPERKHYAPIVRELSRRFVNLPENVRVYASKKDANNEKQLENDPDMPLLRESVKQLTQSEIENSTDTPAPQNSTRTWSFTTAIKLLGKERAEKVQQNILNFRNSPSSSRVSIPSFSVESHKEVVVEDENPPIQLQSKLTASQYCPPLPDLPTSQTESQQPKYTLTRKLTKMLSSRSTNEFSDQGKNANHDQRKSKNSQLASKKTLPKFEEQRQDTRSELLTLPHPEPKLQRSISDVGDPRFVNAKVHERMTAEFYKPPLPNIPGEPASTKSSDHLSVPGSNFIDKLKRKISGISIRFKGRSKSAEPPTERAASSPLPKEPDEDNKPLDPVAPEETGSPSDIEPATPRVPSLIRAHPPKRPGLVISTALDHDTPFQKSPSPVSPNKHVHLFGSNHFEKKIRHGFHLHEWSRPTVQQVLKDMEKWVPDVHKWHCEPGSCKMLCEANLELNCDCSMWKRKMTKISPNLLLITPEVKEKVGTPTTANVNSMSDLEKKGLSTDDSNSEHTLLEDSAVSKIFVPMRNRSVFVPNLEDMVVTDEPMEMDEVTEDDPQKDDEVSEGQVTGGTEGVGFVSGESDGLPIRITWVRGQKLGSGAFANVYLGMCKTTSELIAVKQVNYVAPRLPGSKEKIKNKVIDALHSEIGLLKELNHPNVVKYFGYDVTDTTVSIFLEYVDGGSVASLVSRIGTFPVEMVQSITLQVLEGLSYLHERLIIHRDIKGGNILLTTSGIAKIADFGISKKNDRGYAYQPDNSMSFRGSVPWMAPEVVKPNGYSAKVDVWSLGCVVLEMTAGQMPWNRPRNQMNETQIIYQLGIAHSPPIPDDLNDVDAKDFMDKCLTIEAADRPEVNQLLKHPFITKFDPANFDFETTYNNALQRRQSSLKASALSGMDEDDEEVNYDESTYLCCIEELVKKASDGDRVEFANSEETGRNRETSLSNRSSNIKISDVLRYDNNSFAGNRRRVGLRRPAGSLPPDTSEPISQASAPAFEPQPAVESETKLSNRKVPSRNLKAYYSNTSNTNGDLIEPQYQYQRNAPECTSRPNDDESLEQEGAIDALFSDVNDATINASGKLRARKVSANVATTKRQKVSHTSNIEVVQQKKSGFISLNPVSHVIKFPTAAECAKLVKTKIFRNTAIPAEFNSVDEYQICMIHALQEHLQVHLKTVGVRYLICREKTSKKSGKTYGRTGNAVFRSSGIPFYQNISFSQSNSNNGYYLQIDDREHHSAYSKDDIWAIASDLKFDNSFLARSVFYGPGSNGSIEVIPLSDQDKFKIKSLLSSSNKASIEVSAIRALPAQTDLMMIRNLEENLSELPVLPWLLNYRDAARKHNRAIPSLVDADRLDDFFELLNATVTLYNLNADQARVLQTYGESLSGNYRNVGPVTLVHGIFGAGKSFLVSVMIIFTFEALTAGMFIERERGLKIVISSMTNIAVDRILSNLLKLNFKQFARIGSLKKIAKQILPFTVKSKSNSDEISQLKEMSRDPTLTNKERQDIQYTIEKFAHEDSATAIENAFVVGVTCVATSFESLSEVKGAIVFLDECSQITEPLSILPICQFASERLVLVGDPLQLAPIISTPTPKKISINDYCQGLERTLFERFASMGLDPILLSVQYRCHPQISAISNRLFYENRLVDGVTEESVAPILNIPPVCFIDVSDGIEQVASSGSLTNSKEADYTAEAVAVMLNKGVNGSEIGVISLYKHQVALIEDKLSQFGKHSVQVSTVDAFQGAEKDVIILSTVRSESIGFIDEARRINVAITRAKRHCVILGNRRLLNKSVIWKYIVEEHCAGIENGILSMQEFLQFLCEGGTDFTPMSQSSSIVRNDREERNQFDVDEFLENVDKDLEDLSAHNSPVKMSQQQSASKATDDYIDNTSTQSKSQHDSELEYLNITQTSNKYVSSKAPSLQPKSTVWMQEIEAKLQKSLAPGRKEDFQNTVVEDGVMDPAEDEDWDNL